jgi:hypothetical protein
VTREAVSVVVRMERCTHPPAVTGTTTWCPWAVTSAREIACRCVVVPEAVVVHPASSKLAAATAAAIPVTVAGLEPGSRKRLTTFAISSGLSPARLGDTCRRPSCCLPQSPATPCRQSAVPFLHKNDLRGPAVAARNRDEINPGHARIIGYQPRGTGVPRSARQAAQLRAGRSPTSRWTGGEQGTPR